MYHELFPSERFQHFKPRSLPKTREICIERVKIGKICSFVIFVSFWGRPKNPKISTNTYRMILILRQLNSTGETLQLGYIFGAWQILQKKRLI